MRAGVNSTDLRKTIIELTERLSAFCALPPPSKEAELENERLVTARAWRRANRVLNEVLDVNLSNNPVWNILLELYIEQAEGRAPSRTTSACIGSEAPATSALRYIETLADRGWVERLPDPADRRVTVVQLTADGVAKVAQALDGVISSNHELGIGHLRLI